MEPEMFRDMVDRVVPCIEKSQEGRPLVWQGLKLAITFRFLSTGNSYHSLAFNFRVAHNTISQFVPEVCDAIVMEFEDDVFVTPSIPNSWKEVADNFGKRWNFYHACGALAGKHRAIKKPEVWQCLLQLQRVLFHCPAEPCGRCIQVPVGQRRC